MVFSSTVFLFLFFPIVLAIYYNPFIKSRKFRNSFLLLASIGFYAWGEPIYVGLVLVSIVVTWILGLLIDQMKQKKMLITFGVIYHIGILFVFKYLSFLSEELSRITNRQSIIIKIALPIGISFFTFQMLSYLFDVYYGKVKVQRNLLDLALYAALFPQLIAGPIVRYETIENEIRNRKETWEDFQEGLRRFVVGLGKKALLADFLASIVDPIFEMQANTGAGLVTVWIGAIAYTLEIYFDFSGYSDMAIGLGRCFGFHFKENFNYPYVASSINEFWKRWHISLTDWFRDYVYIPAGGNRVTKFKHFRNTIIIWALTGIWHGANWTFLVWGLVFCIFQLWEKYVFKISDISKLIGHFITMVIVIINFVIFRSDSMLNAFRYIKDMFGGHGLWDVSAERFLVNSLGTLIIAGVLCMPVVPKMKSLCMEKGQGLVYELVSNVILVVIIVLAAMFSISGGYSPFIYFNF